MTDLDDFARLGAADHGLCVIVTTRADGTAQASLVNAGVLAHPRTGTRVVGLVARGDAVKLAHLRARPHATLVVRNGWEWAAVEGPVTIWGPDDPLAGTTADDLRMTLRDVFTAAGGTHDDWPDYDRTMLADRRAAVFVEPERVYSNG